MAILAVGTMALLGVSTRGQSSPKGPIAIQSGAFAFPNPRYDSLTMVEFPFAVNRNQFSWMPRDGGDSGVVGEYFGNVYASLVVSDTFGAAVDSAATNFGVRANSWQDAMKTDIRIFDRLTLTLKPGIYKGILNIKSRNQMGNMESKEGSFIFDRIEIPAPAKNLSISDLQFAYLIKNIGDSQEVDFPRLCKNGREIIPNPMGLYSENDSIIYVYSEIYNLRIDGSEKGSFVINYKIFQGQDALVRDYGETQIPKAGETSVISSSLNISDLPPGRYALNMLAFDSVVGETARASAGFIVVPATFATVPTYSFGERINPLDTVAPDIILSLAKYLLPERDLSLYKSLNDSGKIKFATQFFKDKDPTPGTANNEYFSDVLNRFNLSNREFSSLPNRNDGWRSDRGRVLIQYGMWDDRYEETAPAYGQPWERWYYRSVQGGVLFIFVDEDGTGDKRLVHSTADGEVFSSQWDQRIKDENLQIY
jgi:GWxTD domain-containing protein